MDIDHLPFVQARLYRVNPGRPIDWIVWHDMEAPEGPLTAENTARYFTTAAAKGSAHICVDTNSCVRCVKDEDQAAHAPGSNTNGLGIELCGYARQTRAEWLDADSKATIENAANCTAQWMHKHNVPNIYRSPKDLVNGLRGWCQHQTVTQAFHKSTHTDCGPFFPVDYAQERINHYYYGEPEPEGDDFLSYLTEQQQREMYEALVGTDAPNLGEKNPRLSSVKTMTTDLWNELLGGRDKSDGSAYWLLQKAKRLIKVAPDSEAK